jgi:tetratricopeptide (TPR) repeat protein
MQSTGLNLWRAGLALIAALVIWRVTVLGVAEHYAEGDGGPASAARALAWDRNNATALYESARAVLATDPDQAMDLARRAFAASPVDARPLLVLAQAHLALGEPVQADRLAEQAGRLVPTRVSVLLQMARYWGDRGRVDRSLAALSDALTASPALSRDLFPALLRLAEDPLARDAFTPITAQPPPWWDGFYAYLAQRAVALETVAAFTTLRRQSPVPLSGEERDAAVERLQRENEWPAAYLMWVNGLDPERRRHLGSVYNGGFEAEVTERGFDWHLPRIKGAKAARQHTYGVRGERALRVIFEGREMRFRHLYQPLFLAPGNYAFHALARPDQLQGRGGPVWTVRCVAGDKPLLGNSERYLGSSEWRRSDFRFSVPEEGCSGQLLRLESTGTTSYDHRLEGEIWFDQVAIRRIRGE